MNIVDPNRFNKAIFFFEGTLKVPKLVHLMNLRGEKSSIVHLTK